jgi:hypothetical protein
MELLFLVMAAVGGTVMVLQFVLLLLGLGGDDAEFGGDHGGFGDLAADGDLDGDLSAETELPAEFDAGSDSGGSVSADHGSSHLFAVLSVRSVVAAITFFGLGGLFALRSGAGTPSALIMALGAGGAALAGVYYLMRGLYRLRQDGTVRIRRAIGQEGTVYIPIPAAQAGAGKVQLQVQHRIMEFKAVTAYAERIATGQRVVVLDVLDPETLLVEPIKALSPHLPSRTASAERTV